LTQAVKKYLLYFLILVYVSGAIGYLFRPEFFIPFTPFTLILTCLVFVIHQPISSIKYVFSFLALALVGFFIEVVGVKTGKVFGNYYYGNALGYKIWEVPIIISLNWALLVNIGVLTAGYLSSQPVLLSLIAALTISFLDFLIEQVAEGMDYWRFLEGIAGGHNYLSWFLITFLASLIFHQRLIKGDKKIALIILSLQVFFFGIIYINKLFNFVSS